MIAMATPHVLVSEAFLSPSGVAADGSVTEPVPLPRVSGFVESTFSPLVRAVVTRCLGDQPIGAGEGARTALVLGTTFGDTVTADLGSRLLTSGQARNPLLFYQSVPTTILGVVARDFGITGPTMCFSARADLRDEALDLVDVLLHDDEIDQVLLVGIDLQAGARARRVAREQATPLPLMESDTAVAFLIRRGEAPLAEATSGAVVAGNRRLQFGALSGLAELFAAVLERRCDSSGGRLLTVPPATASGRREWTLVL